MMDESIPPVELSHLNYGDEEKNLEDTLNRSSSHNGRRVEAVMVRETLHDGSDKETLARMEEAAKGLLRETAQLEELGKKNSRLVELVDNIQKQIGKAEEEEKLAASSAQEFAAQEVKTRAKLEKLRSCVSDKEGQVEQERNKLEAELVRWKRALGLELTTSKSGIVITLTNLVRDDPERPFRCELVLLEGNFKVERCNPDVGDLDALVDQLNNTNPVDLSGFVVTLRQRFRDLAK